MSTALYAYSEGTAKVAAPRVAVAVLFVFAAALPVRIWLPIGWFSSFAPIDVLLFASPILIALLQPGRFVIGVGQRSVAAVLFVPVALCVVSYVWTVDAAGTMRALVLDAEAMVAYVVVVTVFQKLPSRTIASLLYIFVLIVILTAALSELHVPGLGPQVPPNLDATQREPFLSSYYSRLSHPYFGLSNNLATVLAFFPFLLAACARIASKARYRWMAAASVIATIATLSRGVVLALAVAWLLWMMVNLRRSGRGYWRMLPYVALVVAVLIAFITTTRWMDQGLASRLSGANVVQRLDAAARVLSAVLARPFGYGAGASLATIAGGDMVNSHNAYLQQFLYFGVAGGAVAVLALIWLPIAARRWRLHSDLAVEARDGLVFGILTSLFAFLSEASYEGSVLRVLFYMSIGLGVALVVALEREACGRERQQAAATRATSTVAVADL